MRKKSELKPLFPTRFSLILSFILLLPFVIRTIAPALEPYPAIVLPAVATKIDVGGDVAKVGVISIYGYESGNNWKRIDPVNLLEPIPVRYLSKIIRHDFGLTQTTYAVDNKLLSLQLRGKPLSKEQEKQSQVWLSDRLQNLGYLNSQIKISNETIEIHLGSGKIIGRTVENEKVIQLL